MIKTRCLLNTKKKVLLSRSEKGDYGIFMEEISKEIEEKIDKQNDIRGDFQYKTSDGFIINNSSTYLYGEINLNNKKDINYLKRFDKALLNPYDYHNWYYTSFDYETGNITYDEERHAWFGINFIADVIKWFKYQYCILGKPKRVIIFKEPTVPILEK